MEGYQKTSPFREYPTPRHRDELKALVGFHVDPMEILQHYLAQGYAPEYFPLCTDDQIWALFPSAADVGITGATSSRRKHIKGSYVSYMVSWKSKSPQRSISLEINLLKSPDMAREMFEALAKMTKTKKPIDMGDLAYVEELHYRNHGWHVLIDHANIFYTDSTTEGQLPDLTLHFRPPRPGLLQTLCNRIHNFQGILLTTEILASK